MSTQESIGTRVLVAGTSGAGKTTLATQLAQRLDLQHVELDALFHGPGWVPRPTFAAEVEEFASRERWTTEWQYEHVRDLLAARATALVWLDLPRHVVMRRVIRRTVTRRVRRTELWNGNREGPLRDVLTDRDHIIRWAWRTQGSNRIRIEQALMEHPHLQLVRLRSNRDVRAWLRSLERDA